MLASTENGASPACPSAPGSGASSAKLIRSVRDLNDQSRHGRDHLDVRVERIGRQFEAHLVVALAGRAMRNGIGAGFGGDLDQPLGDQRRAIEVPSR
jgi:hypothetical protein